MTTQAARAEGAPRATRYSLDGLLGIGDLAAQLHVAEKTVRDWIYRRKVPFSRIGRRVYFDRSVIEGLLAANETAPLSRGTRGNRQARCQKGGGVEQEVKHG
jgi:excisionase family DNA binding protein